MNIITLGIFTILGLIFIIIMGIFNYYFYIRSLKEQMIKMTVNYCRLLEKMEEAKFKINKSKGETS